MQTRPWKPAALAVALAVLALATGACGLFDPPLEPAAVAYYNYMQGMAPGKKYSSFMSPAYRKATPKESIAQLDDILGRSRKKNTRAVEVKRADVIVAVSANFGLSATSDRASFASQSLGKTQWVKDGGKWYLYLGNDAEIEQYGQFPPQLTLPAPAPRRAPTDPDAPQ